MNFVGKDVPPLSSLRHLMERGSLMTTGNIHEKSEPLGLLKKLISAVGTSQNLQSFCSEAHLALGFLLDVFLVFGPVCKKYALISLIPTPVYLWILLWQHVAKVLMFIKP